MRLGALLALAMAVALAFWARSPGEAVACSIGIPEAMNSAAYLRGSGVVATGTLHAATADTIQLRVEEALKGAAPGDDVTINNHQLTTDAACGLHVLSGDPGSKYHDGQHVFVMLNKGADGTWWPGLGLGVQNLPADDLVPVVSPWGTMALTEAERRVRNAHTPVTLLPDKGCGIGRLDPAAIAEYRQQSTVVAEGVFSGDLDGQSAFEIEKLVAGDTGGATVVFVQNRYIESQPPGCSLTLGRQIAFRRGEHMLVFLRPNELGGNAQYRVSGGGAAAVEINTTYVTWGLPTLRDFRRAAEDLAGSHPIAAAASPTPGPIKPLPDTGLPIGPPLEEDSKDWGYGVALAAGLLAAVGVLAFASRR